MDCWASSLGDCAGGQSREHPVSDGIFDGTVITAFGLKWCRDTPKAIGLSKAVAKILCRRHNSALSSYDAEAGKFSYFLSKSVLDEPLVVARTTLDGALLEKWALKTLTNLGYIGALDPRNHMTIPPRPDVIQCLFRGAEVPAGMGLYFVSGAINNDAFSQGLSWQVINNQLNGDVLGMSFALSGVRFIATLVPTRAENKIASMGCVNGVDYSNAKIHYRPTNIILGSQTAGQKTIFLKW